MNCSLGTIHHDRPGFEALVSLWAETMGCMFDDIDIDMSGCAWFDADMCAALGAVLHQLSENLNTVNIVGLRSSVKEVLSKNGFLSYYGHDVSPDQWGTTIRYQRFDVKDDRYFASYIEDELMRRSEIPSMSSGLQKKFRESVFEVFSNAVLHSRTERGIFSCGQFFPKRHRIDFSIADLGIGIRRNVLETIDLDLSPEAAIEWATEKRNTTKRGPVPGGLGLKLLIEFIDLNGGCLQIVSDAGYWRRAKTTTEFARLSHPFPGTVVHLEIDTADTDSYMLSSELSEMDIF